MSSTITVQTVTAGSGLGNTPKIAPSNQAAPNAPSRSPIINPTLRLNAALGVVVIEFRNDAGAITTSIPSQRQIAAYQRWTQTQSGPKPELNG